MARRVPLLVLVGLACGVNALLLADVARPLWPLRAPAPAADAATHPRAVVLGFDGVDPRWLQRYLEADAGLAPGERRLPHLAELARTGAFLPLASEIPPESPVAWASLLTGVNPGRHGIFDFVRPGPTYRPENGMVDIRRMRLLLGRVPIRPPRVRSRLAAPTFLERVRQGGYPVLSLRQPLLFPVPDRPGARMLAGLGTPDLTGGAGFYTVWSAAYGFTAGDTTFGGVRVPLEPGDHPRFDTWLPGPFDPARPEAEHGGRGRARVALSFEVLAGRADPAVAITLDGTTHVVPLGTRSPFFPVTFELATLPAIPLRGRVRFEVKRLDPLLVLSDPVNLDPVDPPMPLTSPPGYGAELMRRYGPFETVGWTEQTFALNDRLQDDASFLRDCLEDMDRGAGILLGELARGGRCVFQVFTATDRALHCFYRYYDEDHPAHEAGRVEALGDPIGQVYARMDGIVGDVLARLEPDDLLLVVSDHGFRTWRWEVNLNRWLRDRGLLVLHGEAPEQNLARFTGGGRQGADAIDWSRTKAVAMGLGQIYLNRRSRSALGILDDEAADALARTIREDLLADLRNPYLPDEEVLREVYLLRELYTGEHAGDAPDLQVGFAAAYRISWQTALLGGMDAPVFEENLKPWSGDHCSTDVREVPGVLLANRPLPPDLEATVRDVAPTVLAFFGLATDDLDGRPLPLEESGP